MSPPTAPPSAVADHASHNRSFLACHFLSSSPCPCPHPLIPPSSVHTSPSRTRPTQHELAPTQAIYVRAQASPSVGAQPAAAGGPLPTANSRQRGERQVRNFLYPRPPHARSSRDSLRSLIRYCKTTKDHLVRIAAAACLALVSLRSFSRPLVIHLPDPHPPSHRCPRCGAQWERARTHTHHQQRVANALSCNTPSLRISTPPSSPPPRRRLRPAARPHARSRSETEKAQASQTFPPVYSLPCF